MKFYKHIGDIFMEKVMKKRLGNHAERKCYVCLSDRRGGLFNALGKV